MTHTQYRTDFPQISVLGAVTLSYEVRSCTRNRSLNFQLDSGRPRTFQHFGKIYNTPLSTAPLSLNSISQCARHSPKITQPQIIIARCKATVTVTIELARHTKIQNTTSPFKLHPRLPYTSTSPMQLNVENFLLSMSLPLHKKCKKKQHKMKNTGYRCQRARVRKDSSKT
jgi:hypothetical protein